ncbi:hypothetical protein [Aliifodinibius salipaludis]|uniref:hypothetical protein n=1 Tax=Fodinibius salipaludis TaxID=2032627 RepID=UPI001595DDD5|nr:hypothetical protein [Aliifodinibius salipaludis]
MSLKPSLKTASKKSKWMTMMINPQYIIVGETIQKLGALLRAFVILQVDWFTMSIK